jgi:hypothetical protein
MTDRHFSMAAEREKARDSRPSAFDLGKIRFFTRKRLAKHSCRPF